MSPGIPPGILGDPDFVQVRLATVNALGGDWAAAILLQRIEWRCRRSGTWRATYADLVEQTGLSEHQIKRGLRTLRGRGWIVAERAGAWDAGLVYSCLYDDVEAPIEPVESTPSTRRITPDRAGDSHPIEPVDSTRSSLETRETRDETRERPNARGQEVALLDVESPFDRFWRTYPRRTGKRDAERAFAAAVKRAPAERILAGAARYAGDLNRVPQYTAHPATWLNRDGWDDDPEPIRLDRQGETLYREYHRAASAEQRGETIPAWPSIPREHE